MTKERKNDISKLVQSFSIDGVSVPDDFDYKKTLADTRNEKYTGYMTVEEWRSNCK
jgi:hypothetical protein